MKRNFLFYSLLFSAVLFLNLTSLQAYTGSGMAYYNAGFPEVAKPLLLQELNSDTLKIAENCFYLGSIYFGENQPDSALYFFNKGLTTNPSFVLNAIGLDMLKLKSAPDAAGLDIDNLLKAKNNKKNVDAYIAASRAYLGNGIFDKALIYQDKAKKVKSKYAGVYVLLGDIELAKGNTGAACSNYELAIYFDDTNKEAYIKYARAYRNVNSALAIDMLNKLKAKDPSFLLVDKELADIYYATNDFGKAAQLYENYLKSGNSNVQDLTKYAMTLFLNKDFEKSLEVANLGLQKAPRNPAFNRLNMWINVDLKNYDLALKAADNFFNKTDKPGFTYLDYRYYGQALKETKQYDLAIVQFQKAFKMDSTKTELLKDISDMYSQTEDYNNAITYYTKYLHSLSPEKQNADELMPLGKLYYSLGTSKLPVLVEKNDSSKIKADTILAKSNFELLKKTALLKADSVFAKVAALDSTDYRGNFYRARTNSVLDPETTLGLADPFYKATAKLVEAKQDPRYNPVLVECYSYIGYYLLLKGDNELSLSYWKKILAIDPNNATAIKAIVGIEKFMKASKDAKTKK